MNQDTNTLGTTVYLEVRWPNPDGGSASVRYSLADAAQANADFLAKKAENPGTVLVSVSTVQLA